VHDTQNVNSFSIVSVDDAEGETVQQKAVCSREIVGPALGPLLDILHSPIHFIQKILAQALCLLVVPIARMLYLQKASG
jgi:hypothetical protein